MLHMGYRTVMGQVRNKAVYGKAGEQVQQFTGSEPG